MDEYIGGLMSGGGTLKRALNPIANAQGVFDDAKNVANVATSNPLANPTASFSKYMFDTVTDTVNGAGVKSAFDTAKSAGQGAASGVFNQNNDPRAAAETPDERAARLAKERMASDALNRRDAPNNANAGATTYGRSGTNLRRRSSMAADVLNLSSSTLQGS